MSGESLSPGPAMVANVALVIVSAVMLALVLFTVVPNRPASPAYPELGPVARYCASCREGCPYCRPGALLRTGKAGSEVVK